MSTSGHAPQQVWRMALAGLALLLAGITLGYVVTAIGAHRTGELRLDVWLTHHRPVWLAAIAGMVDTAIGTITAVCALGLLVVLLLIGGRRVSSVLTEIAMFASALVPTELIKQLYHRARPPSPPVDRAVRLWDPQSMPSGHTAIAVAIVATLCVTLWLAHGRIRWALTAGLPFVLLVGFTRMVVGAHYLGDVTVAVLVSTGTALLAVAALIHFDRLGPAARAAAPLSVPSQRSARERPTSGVGAG